MEQFNVALHRVGNWPEPVHPAVPPRLCDGDKAAGLARTSNAYSTREPLIRLDMPILDRRIADWQGMRIELVTVARGGPTEVEFAVPSHIVMTHLEGGAGGFEWSDGGAWSRLPAPHPGDALFNPAAHPLRIRRRTNNRCHVLLLAVDPHITERLSNDVFDPSHIDFRRELVLSDESLRQTLGAVRDEIEHPGPCGKPYRDSLIMLVLGQLVRCASNLAIDRAPVYSKGGLPGWRLRLALELLEPDCNAAPSLTDVARQLGLHPTSFCRAFKRSTGVSPHRYLLQRRVNRAQEMMADQKLTLTQIALDCGFGSSSQFSVIFRRVTGQSPSVFRRSQRLRRASV